MTNYQKIASIVGARSNFIKLAPINRELKDCTRHTRFHTGQLDDYEMSSIFFKASNLAEPDFNLDVGSGPAGYQVGEMIKGIENIMLKDRCDLILVFGDTNSMFDGAFAGVKSGIKVAHVESGLRSFDGRMPEEPNRILTDNLSNYLFSLTTPSIDNLQNENVFGKIYNTGDISVEIINDVVKLSTSTTIPEDLNNDSKEYIFFIMHRAENTELNSNFQSIFRAFEILEHRKIVILIHQRTKKILEERNLFAKLQGLRNIILTPPIGYVDFVNMNYQSNKIVTDSGGIQKESYLLYVRCITIRNNTEWSEIVTTGWNKLVGIDYINIVDTVEKWNRTINAPTSTSGAGNTSRLIKDILWNNLG